MLLGLLLIGINIFSPGKAYAGSYQDKKTSKAQQDKKIDRQEVDPDKQAPQKPEIKEVPKARKQLKPAAVKPKVKPVKIIRPKIKKH